MMGEGNEEEEEESEKENTLRSKSERQGTI